MASDALVPNQIIFGESLYTEAIHLILAKAQHCVLIFDQDLSQGSFSSVARYELLKNFLNQPATSLSIILHRAEFFQQSCPRLTQLLRIYPHKMAVHITDNSVKNFKSCFIVADGIHYIKRIHTDQARFIFSCNDTAYSEILHQQFLELLAAAPNSISTTTLGL